METFDPDYHESEEALLLVYYLGRVSLEWNMVEQFFRGMIWELLGNYPAGIAVTGGMGNRSKADVILSVVRQRSKNADVIDRVEFACKTFNILRENRNMLIHSHSIFRGENGAKPEWRRASSKSPEAHASTEADVKDLENLVAQICTLGIFVVQLLPFLRRRRRRDASALTLPDKFPMPTLLARPGGRRRRGKRQSSATPSAFGSAP